MNITTNIGLQPFNFIVKLRSLDEYGWAVLIAGQDLPTSEITFFIDDEKQARALANAFARIAKTKVRYFGPTVKDEEEAAAEATSVSAVSDLAS